MKKGQVFTRAINKDNRWDSVDVLDLDDESFKVFIIDRMFASGIVAGIKSELVEGEEIILKERKES